VPCEFIGYCKSQNPIHNESEIVSNHDELMSNFFSQPDALVLKKYKINYDRLSAVIPMTLTAISPETDPASVSSSTPWMLIAVDNYSQFMNTEQQRKAFCGKSIVLTSLELSWEKFSPIMSEKYLWKIRLMIWKNMD
jgi:hypothetical protein